MSIARGTIWMLGVAKSIYFHLLNDATAAEQLRSPLNPFHLPGIELGYIRCALPSPRRIVARK